MGQCQAYGTGSPKKRSGEGGRKEIRRKVTEYFPNLMNAINPQMQETQVATKQAKHQKTLHEHNQMGKTILKRNLNIQGKMTHYVQRNKKPQLYVCKRENDDGRTPLRL